MANETRYIKTPFAQSGTRTEVPNVSVGGAVAFDTGFGPDYELPQGAAGRKRIERDKYNGVLYDVTKNLKQWQEGVYPTWIEDNGSGVPFSYPQGMIVNHAGQDWYSNEASNQEEPGTGGKWSQSFSQSNEIPFDTIADLRALNSRNGAIVPANLIGARVRTDGYYVRSDGGGNWGIITAGTHTDDGGSVISLGANLYVDMNLKGKSVNAAKWGIKDYTTDPTFDNSVPLNALCTYIHNSRTASLPSVPSLALKSPTKIVMPNGGFNIDNTINLPRNVLISGDDTMIHSAVVGLVMFSGEAFSYRIGFEGIIFDGTDAQAFVLNGQNLDNAKFHFDDCAIFTRTQTAGRYAIDILSQSSVVYFNRTDVFDAPNFLKVKADMTRIHGGWINGYRSSDALKPANSASIDSDTQMRVYGTTFIPELDGSGLRPNLRWFNLRGKDIVCESCNFGGENGGIDIVYSYVDARNNTFPYNAEGAVRVINSQVACRSAIVTLVGETATPSKYDFRNNTFTINRYGVSSQGLDFTKTTAETDALLAIRVIDQSSEFYRRTVPEVTYSGVDKSPLYFPECLNSYVNRVHGVVGGSIRNLEAGGGNTVRILQVIKESASPGHFSGFVGKLRVINQNLDVQQIKQYTVYVSWSPAGGVADVDIVQDSFNQNSAGAAGWFDRFLVTAVNSTANSVDFLLTNEDTFAPWAFAYRLEGFTTQNNDTTGGFPIAITGATEQR